MTTLGEIFRRYGPAYRARFGRSLSKSQLQVIQAVAQCRTEALGGHVYRCPSLCERPPSMAAGAANESPFGVASAPDLGIMAALARHDAVKVLCLRDRLTDRYDAPTARVP